MFAPVNEPPIIQYSNVPVYDLGPFFDEAKDKSEEVPEDSKRNDGEENWSKEEATVSLRAKKSGSCSMEVVCQPFPQPLKRQCASSTLL